MHSTLPILPEDKCEMQMETATMMVNVHMVVALQPPKYWWGKFLRLCVNLRAKFHHVNGWTNTKDIDEESHNIGRALAPRVFEIGGAIMCFTKFIVNSVQ